MSRYYQLGFFGFRERFTNEKSKKVCGVKFCRNNEVKYLLVTLSVKIPKICPLFQGKTLTKLDNLISEVNSFFEKLVIFFEIQTIPQSLILRTVREPRKRVQRSYASITNLPKIVFFFFCGERIRKNFRRIDFLKFLETRYRKFLYFIFNFLQRRNNFFPPYCMFTEFPRVFRSLCNFVIRTAYIRLVRRQKANKLKHSFYECSGNQCPLS